MRVALCLVIVLTHFTLRTRLAFAEDAQAEILRLKAHIASLKEELSRRPRSPGDYPVPQEIIFCGERIDLTPPEVRRRFKTELIQVLDQRRFMSNVLRRAQSVFPVIEREAKQVGGCQDLKHLAVAESALIGGSASKKGAKGWWQFIASTAEQYKLTITPDYDARRELISSTRTAFKYLNVLHKTFGTWMLAMASYNTGRGRVKRAQEKQGHSNFWSLDLPLEAERYVPRILALHHVMTHLEEHDFRPSEEASSPPELVGLALTLKSTVFLEKVPIKEKSKPKKKSKKKTPSPKKNQRIPSKKHGKKKAKTTYRTQASSKISLATISQVVGIELINLRQHNPALISEHLPLGTPFIIWIPAQGVEALKKHLAQGLIHHQTLGPLYVDSVRPPPTSTDTSSSITLKPLARSDRSTIQYQVKEGDSLFLISARFGVSVEEVRQWNEFTSSTPLHQGQQLVLYTP